jgi:hypothetical protein
MRALLCLMRFASRCVRSVPRSAPPSTPHLLTYSEKLQYEGYLRCEQTNSAILKLASAGVPIKEIVRRTGRSRELVRQVVRGQRTDIFGARRSSLEVRLELVADAGHLVHMPTHIGIHCGNYRDILYWN